ncbi:TPR repeat protein [Labilithrix luteola]|uniref:TPR repeat protein n=1 Tax=Labilithrix luteola TaxID=1391654 RepID=A0A0K1QB69_9BACT|nr:zinc-ribbon domain-containing protein [Labilithrix luteola]AKV02978.1 TPR repeat protein [Labilithrix luteola]
MDVRCERCNTEYEFDDALVSGRGTTVKCTNCGHKFKIRRGTHDYSEDFWNVQTRDGRILVFTSLRELQRAIQTHLVERGDMLSRGGLPPKAIGQIPELSPFLDTAYREPPAPPSPRQTASFGSRSPRPPGASSSVHPLAAPRQRQSTRPDFPAPPAEFTSYPNVPSVVTTLVGTGPDVPEVEPRPTSRTLAGTGPESAQAEEAVETVEEAPSSRRAPSHPPPPATAARRRSSPPATPAAVEEPAAFEASSPLPPSNLPLLRTIDVDDDGDAPRGGRPSYSDAPASLGRRRSVGGFIVAGVVLAGMGLLFAVWAKDNLRNTLGTQRPAPVATIDPRVQPLLTTGEKALVEGNVELAKESFDKASALAEKDPHVLLDSARLAAVRADGVWLKARLLSADATDERRITQDMLGELAVSARRASEAAIAVAPDDASALRAKIDALRISGDRDGARALVSKINPSTAQAETAYVLAALDLAEAEPLWPTIIERLRTAASGEAGPGRARATLVYALARSGDVPAARVELDRLSTFSRPHPLLPLLRAFTEHERGAAKPVASASASAIVAVAATSADKPEKKEKGEKAAGALPTDPRVLVSQAESFRGKGDYEKARTLYSAALEKNPSDSEALNGIAAIAHAQHDLTGARASYKRVLSINPSYLPALVGLADIDWESGDRASAMKIYKDVVDRFPEGTYPPRVRQRLEAGSAPATPAPAENGGGG